MDEHDEGHELVMPFVTVATVGGPHDDEAYTAGWEMGSLDAELQHAAPAIVERTIHECNAKQADLIAMRHGYLVNLYNLGDGWMSLKLTKQSERV
jgi:hypothetical protein